MGLAGSTILAATQSSATTYTPAHRVALIVGAGGLVVGAFGPSVARVVAALRSRFSPVAGRPLRLSALPSGKELKGDRTLSISTWAVSAERQTYLDRRARSYFSAVGGVLLIFAGAFCLAAYGYALSSPTSNEWRTLAIGEAALGSVMTAYSLMPYLAARSAYKHRMLATASALVDHAITDACRSRVASDPDTALGLPQLFALNRRQLDEYQMITRKQQRSTFFWAQAASVFAFLVLVGGVIVALAASDPVEKYISGGLSGLGALLSAFLANTFFSAATDANKQMNLYYMEPQRTGRLLAIERVVRKLPPSLDPKLTATIISAVLGWEVPPDDATKANQAAPSTKHQSPASSNGKAGAGGSSKASVL